MTPYKRRLINRSIMDTRAIASGVAYCLSDDEEDEDDTVLQIADLPSTGISTTRARASARPFTANQCDTRGRISRLRHPPRRRRVSAQWQLMTRFLPASRVDSVTAPRTRARTGLRVSGGGTGAAPLRPRCCLCERAAGHHLRVSRHRCGQGESAIVLLSRIFVPGTGFASRARVDRASERMS